MKEQQAELFLLFVVFGAACALLYDLLRAFRKEMHHGLFWVMAEDVLFSALACAGCYSIFFMKNQGALRAYGFLGILLGVLLYHFTIGGLMQHCFRCFFKTLSFPIKWILRKCKIWKSRRKALTKQEG